MPVLNNRGDPFKPAVVALHIAFNALCALAAVS